MKNLMKKQMKKSFSLFLAVLMLMSCWVWVAPQKAEAAAPNNYTVELNFTVSDACNGGEVRADVTHVANNGTGSATTTSWALDKCESDEGTYSLTKDFSGFPTKIYWLVKQGGVRTQEIKLNYIKINGTTILQGGWTLNPGHWSSGDRTFEKSGEIVGGDLGSPSVNSWPTPKLESASVSLSPTSHTLARINSGTNSTSTITLSGHKDQYGVNWTGPLTNTFTLRTDGDVNVGSSASSSGSGNSRTITITPWFQTYFPAKQNAKLYIDWTTAGGSGKKTGTETITIDFPTYKATFHANGGLIGDDSSSAMTEIEVTSDNMNYGSVIGKAPAYAAKQGFEFKGFYSTKYDDATGKTASFDENKKFKDSDDDNPTTVPNTGDTNWYAAWQALPITATFMTADNQLIGTVEGRYNNYMTASNMYNGDAGLNAAVKASHTSGKVKFNNNNEPIYTDGSTSYTFAGWKIIKAYDESVMDKNEDTVLKGDVTFQAVYTKADAATYTVEFKNAEGDVISEKSGYKYRDQVTNVPATEPTKATDDRYEYAFIGWAKDIGKNFYTVDANNQDENGATIAYTHKDGAEFIVKGDASYVPVFRMVPREYKVTYNYTGDNKTPESTVIEGYHWEDAPRMPEIKDNYTDGGYRYYIDGWQINGTGAVKQLDEIAIEGDMTLTAHYGAGEAAKYTINFYGKAEDGVTDVLLNGENNIYEHNSAVTAPEVPQTIDTEDSLYTFAGWSPAVNTTASGDADYYAIYTKKDYADIHFYNYDGTLIYETIGKEKGLFVGETIPAYTGETPVKAEDVIGTYNFTGWADGQRNPVDPGTDNFTGDTYLYAQFETVYKEYTVKFENEGEVVSEKTYHYGDEITVPANPTKASDVEYIYDFRAWSPDVSEVCYGDATYTATYRRTPQYYKVTWLKDDKTVLSESNYTYNSKIQQAVMENPVDYPDADEGMTWVLDYWVQCNASGQPVDTEGNVVSEEDIVRFVRGQKMPAESLYFYPVFRQEKNIIKVEYYKEDGTTWIGTAMIPYGGSIKDYGVAFEKKAPKDADEKYHYIIKWVNNVENGAEVTVATADTKVKVYYDAIEHNPQFYEVVAEPTCNVQGYANYKCSADECNKIFYNVVIPPIEDTASPTGQINVGGEKIWTLEEYNAGINYSEITYVNPNTFLVVNTEDLGSISEPWNSDGEINRGVGKIEYSVSEGTTKPENITKWTSIYDYEQFRTDALNAVLEEKGLTLLDYNGYNHGTAEDRLSKAAIDRAVDAILSVYNANATGVVSNLNLVDGKEYVIYIKVSDREGSGEVNTCYFSSGTISYGTKAPEIAVSGEGYGTKFCDKVDVRITDDGDGLEILLDGEAVKAYTNPGTTSANGTFVATFETEEPGVHTVTVVDKHGNKSTKIFEIKGGHTYRNYTTAATCKNDGARYDVCTVCGAKANEVDIPAIGHNYINFIDKAPDCMKDGYRTYVCDNNCGTKLVLKPTDDAETIAQAKVAVDPEAEEIEWRDLTADDLKHLRATGVHTYEKVKNEDGSDSEEDAWVIDKAPTCKVEGSKHKDCTKCGARETAPIPVDTENGHKFYREKVTLEPTCIAKGAKTKTCRYCGEVVKTADIDALGHTAGEYKTIVDATCDGAGSKILTCAVCNVEIGEPIKDENGNVTGFDGEAVEIPALGHNYKIDGEVYPVTETNKETGEEITVYYQNYKCSRCGGIEKKKLDGYVPPVEAKVSFVNGEEATELNTQEITKFVGESIAADAVTVPTKDADATYTYTFSHWADEDGNAVKFPIEVKGDATYYAVYAERYINYTITYYAEDGTTEIGKTGYLHNGDKVTLAKGPSKAATTLYTYEFNGWAFTTDATKVFAEEYTIDGANVNLKATYTQKDRYYAVTYAYDTDNILETFLVKAGTAARDCFEIPTKAYDDVAHYVFAGWDKATQLAKVESNIYTTPVFDAVAHSYVKDESSYKAATCTTPATYNYVCGCGHSEIRPEGKALGHYWSEPYENADGELVVKCQRADCGIESKEGVSTHSITYYNAIGKVYTHSYNVLHNTELNGDILPAAPEKAADKMYSYTFKGWSTEAPTSGEDKRTVLDNTYKVTEDLELYPVFTATVRTYTVVYAYNAGNIIGEENVNAGKAATKTFENIEKASDTKYHYTFNKWNKATELEAVYSDIYTTPDFTPVEHSFTIVTVKTDATCTTDRVDTYACACGYSYDRVVPGTALGHEWGEAVNGVKKCTRCDATSSESVTYSIVYYNAKGNVYTRAYNIVPGTALKTVLPLNGPAKAADKEYTYTFKGWATKADDGTLTPVAADATVDANLNLYPVYDSAKRTYTVKFLNATGDVIYETTVEAGEAAVCTVIPTKAHDTKYHYTFNNKWDKSEELKAVYSDIVTSAEFTPVEHTISGGVTTAATCQQKEIKTYTCSGCDYSYTVEGKLGDHKWGEPVNGFKTCELCGETEEVGGVVEYTVKYYANETATTAISTKTVKAGTKIADISVITPSKDKDDEYTYAFSHWAYKDTEAKVADDAVVEGNIELVAIYTSTARKYTVIFGYDGNNTIAYYFDKTFAEISADLYEGTTPTKKYDNNNHYTFSGWKLENKDANNNAYIYYAQFDATAHSMKIDSSATVGATCTKGESILEKCEYCDYTFQHEQGGPLGHKLVEKANTRVPATPTQKGSVIFECIRCDYEEKRDLVWSDSGSDDDSGNTEQSKNATIKVSVTDGRNAVQNAKVDIYSGGNYITTKYTNAQGVTTFEVAKGKYNIVITVTNADKVEITKDVQADCEIVGTVSIRGCGCACHRDNIWGAIFRFFHKIIKMLTGEFKCCSDPSHLYG